MIRHKRVVGMSQRLMNKKNSTKQPPARSYHSRVGIYVSVCVLNRKYCDAICNKKKNYKRRRSNDVALTNLIYLFAGFFFFKIFCCCCFALYRVRLWQIFTIKVDCK